MGCSNSNSRYLASNLNINVHTTPAFSEDIGGNIKIECSANVMCEWKHNGNAALLDLSHDRRHAKHVPPGIYEIICTNDMGESITTTIEVEQLQIPCVEKYIVEHATSDRSRDGKITVKISNILENVRYLWTSGIITDEPILCDVQPGIYAVTLISTNSLPILFYHSISPAIIQTKRNEYTVNS